MKCLQLVGKIHQEWMLMWSFYLDSWIKGENDCILSHHDSAVWKLTQIVEVIVSSDIPGIVFHHLGDLRIFFVLHYMVIPQIFWPMPFYPVSIDWNTDHVVRISENSRNSLCCKSVAFSLLILLISMTYLWDNEPVCLCPPNQIKIMQGMHHTSITAYFTQKQMTNEQWIMTWENILWCQGRDQRWIKMRR